MAEHKPKPSWPRMMSFQCRQANLTRLVMNYLVTEGYRPFMTDAAVNQCPMMANFDDLNYAMDLANRLHPRIFESENYVYFHMQQLRLLELLREREQKVKLALSLAQGQAAGFAHLEPEHIRKMARAMGLLALDHQDPFSELLYYSYTYRQKVAGEINAAMKRSQWAGNEHLAETVEPRMIFLIKLILWAQAKLDREGCNDYYRLDFELAIGDFEEEFRRSFQGC